MLYTVVNAGVMFIRSSMTAGNLKTPESYEPWKVHLSKLFGIHNVKSGFYRKPLFCENADSGIYFVSSTSAPTKDIMVWDTFILWSTLPIKINNKIKYNFNFFSFPTVSAFIVLVVFSLHCISHYSNPARAFTTFTFQKKTTT